MKCSTPYCRNERAPKKGKLCHACAQSNWRLLHPMTAAYAGLRHRARHRGIPFSISLEDFERFASRTRYLELTGPFAPCLTVDRRDNLRGYERGNIQALTRSANSEKRMKQDACRLREGNRRHLTVNFDLGRAK